MRIGGAGDSTFAYIRITEKEIADAWIEKALLPVDLPPVESAFIDPTLHFFMFNAVNPLFQLIE